MLSLVWGDLSANNKKINSFLFGYITWEDESTQHAKGDWRKGLGQKLEKT